MSFLTFENHELFHSEFFAFGGELFFFFIGTYPEGEELFNKTGGDSRFIDVDDFKIFKDIFV